MIITSNITTINHNNYSYVSKQKENCKHNHGMEIDFYARKVAPISSICTHRNRSWSFKYINPFLPTVPTFAVRETASLGIMGAPRVPPLNPSESIVLSEHYRLWGVWGGHPRRPHYAERRSLSDSKCWNGGHKWDIQDNKLLLCGVVNWGSTWKPLLDSFLRAKEAIIILTESRNKRGLLLHFSDKQASTKKYIVLFPIHCNISKNP